MNIEQNSVYTHEATAAGGGRHQGQDWLVKAFTRLAEGIVTMGVTVLAVLLRLILLTLRQIVRPR